jgi:hypothetical protein
MWRGSGNEPPDANNPFLIPRIHEKPRREEVATGLLFDGPRTVVGKSPRADWFFLTDL